ncbi:MAG: sulfate adenylyltransferase [Nitrospirae bacterium CG18_big_fil_WC_8_21_14_2_50_70_55]|nr:sulfate adenylyltransferase [Deltaproteobacteria bacterium]OIP66763.1 MAG: sulfate adenylyltransferase [Nitrospirae bacterium CG2_30_70_394]PIQ06371.1 MAG: sulfate adenylyltransferase [Nitrospirae bacterium CG18_big_fil_WC_8_21_14_2_50_70_55]PIU77338.1 MAG: sulfate adenylyltransferase [Nitrospirae bacterium CG06_land_8_20_14_3_00_70_43]PIW83894.1 MAG: sulfate adenylyltransferase [Nitrospirae bacterium CG_4_8_14_3_um_filter_70_85]PIX82806.1 MAG: sulfate adenylyltransferase [Nitrospirae bacte
MALVRPHGGGDLKPLLLTGNAQKKELAKAQGLTQVKMTSRETGDLIMMGIGGFTPLEGFMTKGDWQGVCDRYQMANGLFWPIPITLSTTQGKADSIKLGEEIALVEEESGEIMGTMKVTEKYTIDKAHECQCVFKTTDMEHPGVAKVMEQEEVNLAGPVKVLSEGSFPTEFKGIYMTPAQTRAIFESKGWNTVAAFQTRNPMHRSHEYLAKIAIEITDGVLIHQLLGKLKPGDIPADVRRDCINALTENYFVKDTYVQAGYPLDMRYAGPREALLHALFRQNYGCSHLLVGRDHAGVGDYYGPFDAHKIFEEIPKGAMETQAMKIDWTFYCKKCDGMASMKTCPHGKEDRMLLSGTKMRKMLSEGEDVPPEFSRPEVVEILKRYYATLEEKVEIKLHRAATGE